MLIFLLCLAAIPVHQETGNGRYVTEVVRQYQFTGDNDQLTAHALTLLAVTFFSAIAFILARRNAVSLSDRIFAWKPGILTSVSFFILGLIVYFFWLPRWVVIDAAIFFTLWALFVAAAPYLSVRTINLTTVALIGGYFTMLVVPGFLVHPIALMSADPVALSQFELHLLHLTMPGHEIASGLNFFDQLPMEYGLLSPSIMSVIDRFHHDMTLGNQLRFVQVWQLLFSVGAVVAYFSFRSRNLLGILFAMLLAGPYWATAGLGIWHPNQTGMRSIGLPLGILAIAFAGRLTTTQAALWLGGVAGLVLLSNLETSIAISVGFVVYFIVRTRDIPIKAALYAIAGFVGALLAYGALYSLAMGRLPMALHLGDVLGFVRPLSSAGIGDGGRLFNPGVEKENLYIVPFALIMFGNAIYIVIASFIKLGHRKLSQRESMRAAIATILLVWLAYYFRIPNWWQIWTHLFLYGFLIVETMDPRLFAIGFPREAGLSVTARLRSMRIAPGRLVLLFFWANDRSHQPELAKIHWGFHVSRLGEDNSRLFSCVRYSAAQEYGRCPYGEGEKAYRTECCDPRKSRLPDV